MFKIHKGICICHGEPNFIVVKAGYCRAGNEAMKRLKKGLSKFVAPIAKTSDKRAKLDLAYSVLRKNFLKNHPVCQVKDCEHQSTDVHHKKGRGEYYLDETTFLAVCRSHHIAIEKAPLWAKAQGYSLDRLSK
jgi:hypothetical protein